MYNMYVYRAKQSHLHRTTSPLDERIRCSQQLPHSSWSEPPLAVAPSAPSRREQNRSASASAASVYIVLALRPYALSALTVLSVRVQLYQLRSLAFLANRGTTSAGGRSGRRRRYAAEPAQ